MKSITLTIVLTAVLCLSVPEARGTGISETIPKSISAPKIDGDLNDPAWDLASVYSDFKTMKPDFGREPSEKTLVYVTYDSEFFYVAFRCFDSEPGKIKAALSRRDSAVNDDWVAFCIDTAGDRLSAYAFLSNPLGIQMDGMLDAGAEFDGSWDGIWTCAAKLTEDGYAVEMAIPFKSLRFPAQSIITMGFKAARNISRKSEEVDFPEYDPAKGAALAQFRKIELSGIRGARTRELLPYITWGRSSRRDPGELKSDGSRTDLGFTTKLGIASDLTLSATYNPDFSQVETDAGKIDVNLRAALFYPEKRPFFLEGSETNGFAAASEDSPLGAIVHTRTIVDPRFGLKLNGKVMGRNLISLLVAVDDYTGQDATAANGHQEAHPVFAIARWARPLHEDSYFGGFLVNRDFAGGSNRVFGSDGRFRLTGSSSVEFHAFGSYTRDSGAPAAATGSALAAEYKYKSRRLQFWAGLDGVSRAFRADTGYLSRTGILAFPISVYYMIQTRSRWLQKVEPFYWSRQTRDAFSGLFESYNVLGMRLFMTRQTEIRIGPAVGTEVFGGRRFDRGSFRFEAKTQPWKQFRLEFAFRRGGLVYYDARDPYQGHGTQASISTVLQPTEKISSALDVSYEDLLKSSDGTRAYRDTILRNRTVFQLNRYLFLRSIIEYNMYHRRLNADFLASFTFVPGTVIYFGYGSEFQRYDVPDAGSGRMPGLSEAARSIFFKASYLWRF